MAARKAATDRPARVHDIHINAVLVIRHRNTNAAVIGMP
jgi:hypothetical protein